MKMGFGAWRAASHPKERKEYTQKHPKHNTNDSPNQSNHHHDTVITIKQQRKKGN
jgi:hypothetical protein